MSDKIVKAYREYCEKQGAIGPQCVSAFEYGYLSGQQSAWQLPEVRAEDLVVGELYRAHNKKFDRWVFVELMKVYSFATGMREALFATGLADPLERNEFDKFLGPLPMPGGG